MLALDKKDGEQKFVCRELSFSLHAANINQLTNLNEQEIELCLFTFLTNLILRWYAPALAEQMLHIKILHYQFKCIPLHCHRPTPQTPSPLNVPEL